MFVSSMERAERYFQALEMPMPISPGMGATWIVWVNSVLKSIHSLRQEVQNASWIQDILCVSELPLRKSVWMLLFGTLLTPEKFPVLGF